ncbi:carbonic anhydrase [Aquabacter cavernae]|uniref:carbonic anhydrase n=1 Tax=Aquabacter cavernae TaxID=2496029 RepID=UPI000F8DA529|nr:carbonic anhydrase [Aquabacter cavernae]
MCARCGTLSRRAVVTGAAALAGSLFCGGLARAELREPVPPPNAIAPLAALEKLRKGNERYVRNRPIQKSFSVDVYARAKKQFPFACILSCADSRVAPELVFDQRPGELFVVRVAGNVVDEYGVASLEYAVKMLGVPLIVVMGHTGCGAVAAAIEMVEEKVAFPGSLPRLVDALRPAVAQARAQIGTQTGSDLLTAAVEANARINANRLRASKPVIGATLEAGKLAVVPALYTLATGRFSVLTA